ncbi:hypothetical protein IFR04_009999 [Cadophora malorum]|uniref:Uncharacterized protein n=1 Tax=Cadophora malorum TaxID=108018 RepID=A0A8H7TBZ9_9HELO|nr:hypothetical protein IFR04_009999 [Cadophora malorum]
MPTITSTIRIAASPEVVREKFLDFSWIPEHKPAVFKSIQTPDKPSPSLGDGDRIIFTTSLGGKASTVEARIASNRPDEFSWGGLPFGLLHGVHSFRFVGVDDGRATNFVHGEDFSGLLGFLFGGGYLARLIGLAEEIKLQYSAFSIDFRKWVEEGECQEERSASMGIIG